MMEELIARAEGATALLKARGERIAVAESSTGGLISAALLAVPGASAYFLGGAVVYTREARRALLDIPDAALSGMRSASEPYAELLAKTVRRRFAANWGLAETGAAGPTGNSYGDAAGHVCLALASADGKTRVQTIETGGTHRHANMQTFAAAALEMLVAALRA